MDNFSSTPPLPELTGAKDAPPNKPSDRIRKRDLLRDVPILFVGRSFVFVQLLLFLCQVTSPNTFWDAYGYPFLFGTSGLSAIALYHVLGALGRESSFVRTGRLLCDGVILEVLTSAYLIRFEMQNRVLGWHFVFLTIITGLISTGCALWSVWWFARRRDKTLS